MRQIVAVNRNRLKIYLALEENEENLKLQNLMSVPETPNVIQFYLSTWWLKTKCICSVFILHLTGQFYRLQSGADVQAN